MSAARTPDATVETALKSTASNTRASLANASAKRLAKVKSADPTDAMGLVASALATWRPASPDSVPVHLLA